MLKNKSIKIMKESQRKNKEKAFKNHIQKQKQRFELKQIKERNYRNLNTVVLTEESFKHAYSKFIVSLVLKNSKKDIITEFSIRNFKVDVYCPDLAIFIELEKNGKQKKKIENKLTKYDSLIQSGIINDIFIFDLNDFTLNLTKDMEMVKNKLGI